jgi:predicted lipid carrier protein YhbT
MSQTRYALPAQLGNLLARLPGYPGSVLFVAGLNLALVKHLPPDVRASLAGKKLRIEVTDAQLKFDFLWQGNAFCATHGRALPDLTIAASAHDFLLLAQREEDPDTLFFSRRLAMEGDTELGLLIKNTLDAIEQPVFDPAFLLPQPVRERLKRLLRAPA